MLPRTSVLTVALLGSSLVCAFDAGHIPKGSWLTGHAYRHGDIDDSLHSFIANRTSSSGPWHYLPEDATRIYFGNWLRDYSQIVDVGALKILDIDILESIVQVIGYINFGFGQREYIINTDILGVYQPVQHIDNPSGYAGGIDARTYDSRLRPPVNPRELDIDPISGMKNYIANESGGWDTSTAWVRRTMEAAVSLGRQYMKNADENIKYDAYRALGAALHTLEDFMSHSNFVELTLIHLGYDKVFPFVGNQTQVRSPSGKMVWPLVTGVFSGADMSYSVLGEIADYLSQESVNAIKEKVQRETLRLQNLQAAKANNTQRVGKLDTIQSIIANLTAHAQLRAITSPKSSHRRRALKRIEVMRWNVERDTGALSKIVGTLHAVNQTATQAKEGKDNPNTLSKAISSLIALKDDVEATVLGGIKVVVDDAVAVEKQIVSLRDNLSLFISQQLEPLMTPLISMATKEIQDLMDKLLVKTADQWEVFNVTTSSISASCRPGFLYISDSQIFRKRTPSTHTILQIEQTNPTHSILSKDHFSTILNEPAGSIATLITTNAVSQITKLWEQPWLPVDPVMEQIHQSIFHPDFVIQPLTGIQADMVNGVKAWIDAMDEAAQFETVQRLTKDAIRNFRNVRFELEGSKEQDKALEKQAAAQAATFMRNITNWPGHSHGSRGGGLYGDGHGHMGLDSRSSPSWNGTVLQRRDGFLLNDPTLLH